MEQVTPQAVYDLYALLSEENKRQFLIKVGRSSTAEVPFLISNQLSRPQLFRFSEMLLKAFISQALPIIEQEARRLAKEKPTLSDEEFDSELHEAVKHLLEYQASEIAALEREQLKDARDPKPCNTERDDEIVRLRDKEGKTFGQIGRLLVLKNPDWRSKGGSPLSREAVEKAYHRRKAGSKA